jgi:hypothetical protein
MKKRTTLHFAGAFLLLSLLYFSACQKDSEITNTVKDDETTMLTTNTELTSRAAPRPFKGTTKTWLVEEGDVACACSDMTTIIGYGEGGGQVTHLGNVSEELTVCIEEIVFDENGEFVEGHIGGVCVELTAANGDEVWLLGGPHIFKPAPGCFCMKAQLKETITGGTGRFEGASGQVDVLVTFDIATGIYTEEYDGWISY